ncbi:hypothetical protein A2617_01705 [Candidatus Daviesbacteria bacterium RIFOXYD1_FULL_41_10]|uniref:NTP pyrophosphohydrolase MazG-like domain-containing protein n=1 Tax=Candidatus Daviesbacteria bacterium RIFOXYD1_FULL_41_10 TaxID=1797801 RepID=A0A1F5MZJ8_9BACT|nr:MAG: hypothetical protein A2617_01705 [Candidatus Daviesbacteria bacterium RIFOXYD1_FULL_41_10]
MLISLQKEVREVSKKLNLANTPELCCLDLSSEVGEIAKEVLELTDYGKRGHIYNPDLARELGDAFYSLISLANTCNIDLKKELRTSLAKYKVRETQRQTSRGKLKVKLKPIVLAKNFLCLNAVAGCRNNCVYCYKHGWDIRNKFIPEKFCEVSEILDNLKSHKYYHPNIPLAIHNSATDPFQTGVTGTTFEILDGLERMKLTNIVGLITKEYMTDQIITRLQEYKNIRPIIFVTFSCLPQKYERVVVEKRLLTMKNLSKSRLKKVLYYRPIIRGVNDSENCARKIVDLGEKYFHCIVRSPIKLDVNIIEYMAKQGIFIDPKHDIGLNIHDSCKKMLPESRNMVDAILAKAKIPYFKKTSCAISYLFNQPDYNCQWIRQKYYCSPSCPVSQKNICRKAIKRQPAREDIDKLHQHLGLQINYQIDKDHILLKSKQVFYSDVKYLRMALKFPVLIDANGETLTAEEYDSKYVNADRDEVRKLIKKMGIPNYS